jgi:hypothetical protein
VTGVDAVNVLIHRSRPIEPGDPWRVDGEVWRGEALAALSARVGGTIPHSLPDGVAGGRGSAGAGALIVTIEGAASGGAFESWGPAGRARLDATLRGLIDLARARNLEVWVRPAAESLVSDLPTLVQLARRHEADPIRILLEPAALLTDTMLATADDFVERCAEAVVPMSAVVAVLVTNTGGKPVQEGPISRRALAGLWRAALAHRKPVALRGERVEEQRRWLGVDGGGSVLGGDAGPERVAWGRV